MKRVIGTILLISLVLVTKSQSGGIQWAKDVNNWNEVLKKAKAENKSIFIDFFATWCAPCHAMDKSVYTDTEVGNFFNEKFISVKVQMDKTEHDNQEVKNWYPDAKRLGQNYTVTSFPTFLFFSSEGKPLHRGVGFREPKDFLALSKEAFDPTKQYYAILENYLPGKLDTSELKGLARAFKYSGKELAAKMAVEYLSKIPFSELSKKDNQVFMSEFNSNSYVQDITYNYLKKIPKIQYNSEPDFSLIRNFRTAIKVRDLVLNYLKTASNSQVKKQLNVLRLFKKDSLAKPIADKYINSLFPNDIYTKDNLQFVGEFTKSSKDKGFKIFYDNSERIAQIIGIKDYATGLVKYVIDAEEVYPFFGKVEKEDNVPWNEVAMVIENKYGKKYADEIVLDAKVRIYDYLANKFDTHWREYIKYNIEKIERFGTDTTNGFAEGNLNNFVFDGIFYHSTDVNEMNIGLKLMEGILRRSPKDWNLIDTYANLLYKVGRIADAIKWQEKGLIIAKEVKDDYGISSIEQSISKMKQGVPTWIKSEVK